MPTVRYSTINGEIIAEKRDGVRRTYVPDPLGSTRALLDTQQQITDRFDYRPYGEARTRTGSTSTPFRFVGSRGYYRDTPVRSYVRARSVRADLGQWTSVDPFLGNGPSNRPYAYAANSPTSITDPSGLIPAGLAACAACLLSAAIVCSDCGDNYDCWNQCITDIWNGLDGTWSGGILKEICSEVCTRRIGCRIRTPGGKPPAPGPGFGGGGGKGGGVGKGPNRPPPWRRKCQKLFDRCIEEGWKGKYRDTDCFLCFRYCLMQGGKWPNFLCSPKDSE